MTFFGDGREMNPYLCAELVGLVGEFAALAPDDLHYLALDPLWPMPPPNTLVRKVVLSPQGGVWVDVGHALVSRRPGESVWRTLSEQQPMHHVWDWDVRRDGQLVVLRSHGPYITLVHEVWTYDVAPFCRGRLVRNSTEQLRVAIYDESASLVTVVDAEGRRSATFSISRDPNAPWLHCEMGAGEVLMVASLDHLWLYDTRDGTRLGSFPLNLGAPERQLCSLVESAAIQQTVSPLSFGPKFRLR